MLWNSSGGVSLESYLAPSGERVLAGSGLDGFQRLTPEPVVVTSPSILTHTKEPHLRSSNLNFFSPTIGVRFTPCIAGLSHQNVTQTDDRFRCILWLASDGFGSANRHIRLVADDDGGERPGRRSVDSTG